MKLNPMHKKKYVASGTIVAAFLMAAWTFTNEPNEGSIFAKSKAFNFISDIMPPVLLLALGSLKYTHLRPPSIAIHEAGHVISSIYRPNGGEIFTADIMYMFDRDGVVMHTPIKEESELTDADHYNLLICMVSGKIAEEIYFGPNHKFIGHEKDYEMATDLAAKLIEADKDDTSVSELIAMAEKESKALMQEKFFELENVAKALLEKNYLSLEEIHQVLDRGNTLPEQHL